MSKNVLSKTLTTKSALLLTNLEKSFKKPILFFPIADLDANYPAFGAVDTYSSGSYKVWLREDLPQDPFEANIFHELRHIWQIENNFPTVCNKKNFLLFSDDNPFFRELGTHLSVAILDIDVINWLTSKGYSSNYFINSNFDLLMRNKDNNYDKLDDKYNFANFVSIFVLFYLIADEQQKETVSDAYMRYSSVISTAKYLANEISTYKLDVPRLAALCMGLLLDELKIWDLYYVQHSDGKIRTPRELAAFQQNCI